MALNQSTVLDELLSSETQELMISTYPIENGWRHIFPLCFHQGFWCSLPFLKNIILAQQHFKAEPSDVFVCSNFKSGTTWLKAMTFSIVTRTRVDNSNNPLLNHLPHNCVPDLNICFSNKPNVREPGLPLIFAHTPYDFLPKSVLDSECKIVYICRDPKDTFVSLFHFYAKIRPKENEPLSLEEACELYCEGKSSFGPFWDHILGYWKACLERPEKVMFLKYEEVMEDPTYYMKKLAEFMGYPFSTEEEEQGLVEKIVEMCSFESLSNLEVNKSDTMKFGPVPHNAFFRKGKVGDWKNHLTPSMAEKIDKIIEQKMSGFGLRFGVTSK